MRGGEREREGGRKREIERMREREREVLENGNSFGDNYVQKFC